MGENKFEVEIEFKRRGKAIMFKRHIEETHPSLRGKVYLEERHKNNRNKNSNKLFKPIKLCNKPLGKKKSDVLFNCCKNNKGGRK